VNAAGGDFEHFLLWERSARDTLEVKRIYIDMAGDLVAGVVLSQIVYWHLPARDGRARLQVEKDGQLWLAKSRTDWWEECRISPKQADRALDVLADKGLIAIRLFKFGIAPTKHVRIVQENFLQAWKAELDRQTGPREDRSDFDQRSKSISTKGENRISPKGYIHFPQRVKSLYTETTTETTTAARAADEPHAPGPDLAAADLIQELRAQGVGRSVAEQLAREEPDLCRRYLEFLPYADIRTTKGAWLVDAIRNEYGPPPRYLAAQKAKNRARPAAHPSNARPSRKDDRHETISRWLRATYGRMEKEQGEAFLAFTGHVAGERKKAERMAAQLSAARREQYLASFDTEDHRLELFARWLEAQPGTVLDRRPPESQSGQRSPELQSLANANL
jgi:hypothetical protein